MNPPKPPNLKQLPAAKQRRLDELLAKNSDGTLTPHEQIRLQELVDEAEALMVANAKLLADFAKRETPSAPDQAVPVTVWVVPEAAET